MTSVSLKRRHSVAFDPSPLFRLPLELLEEISYYFTRAEAVQVLTVNSTLHEIFANRIWRSITSTDQTVWKAPASAWTRYGHLVRSLVISDELFIIVCMPNLPKLLKLEVFLDEPGYSIFEYEMPLLQRLDVKCFPESTAFQMVGAMAAAKWVAEAESRNQNVSVNWSLRTDYSDRLDWLGDMLDTVTRPEHYSVTLRADDNLMKLSESNAAKLAVMLVNFTYDGRLRINEGSVLSAYSSFITNSKHVFTKLQHLSIELTYDSSIDSDKIPKLRDTQFPVLDSIEIRAVRDSHVYRCGLKFDGDFSTVTKMQLTDCDNIIWSIVTPGCFTGVRDLTLSGVGWILNPRTLARQFPVLFRLVICESYGVDFSFSGAVQSGKAVQLQYLEELEIRFSHDFDEEITADMFRFIFYHAPKLHSIDFSYGWFECSALYEFVNNGVVNTSVRHLSVTLFRDEIEDGFNALSSLLPNLERLELIPFLNIKNDVRNELCNQYPFISLKEAEDE
ncbi:hypothetical protein GQ42DRAFT_179672 [Ramicandelaber brevisporus]|nr:hypothetical protein GQ42DRAFT_179672 [Ramicandelaber brevisporus]